MDKRQKMKAFAAAVVGTLPTIEFCGAEFKVRRVNANAMLFAEASAIAKELALFADENLIGANTLYVATAMQMLNDDGTCYWQGTEALREFIELSKEFPAEFERVFEAAGLKAMTTATATNTTPVDPSEVSEKN